jgi:cytochrome c oxidase assembly factor CtaG
MHPVDTLGILPLLQSQWELTHATDQRIGGLMMWVPACFVYLTVILVITKRWLSEAHQMRPTEGSRGIG